MNDIVSKFQRLDYFTQRTIINEFPEVFPEYTKQPIDTSNHEYFPSRRFNINEFYGGFLLVLGIIAVIGYIFG